MNLSENISLSKREIEVMSFVKEGLTSKEISGKLNRHQKTVEKHIMSVRMKFHAKNIAHAVALFVENKQKIISRKGNRWKKFQQQINTIQ